jgi:hypothetical protein
MHRELQPYQVQDLTERLETLRSMWAGRFTDGALRHWVKTLSPYYGQTLFRVLEQGMNEKSMPSLGHILEALHQAAAREAQSKPVDLPQELTPDQKRKADTAAIRSMVWLVLVKGWDSGSFSVPAEERKGEPERAGNILARMFKTHEQMSGDFIKAVIDGEGWTKEKIAAWMRDQEAVGN